jgi:hypothetical protein
MNVLGYSERGIINALFHEISYSGNADQLFHLLISLASFPFTKGRPPAGKVDLFIEQSFSDFGDADALALIKSEAGRGCSLFIEAKVKPFQANDWLIADEFDEFQKGLQKQVSSSNLFTQLYHKVRLVKGLANGGILKLQEGVPFPSWSSKQLRKIGSNGVVLNASRRLQDYTAQSFFLALIPDSLDRVQSFFENKFRPEDIRNIEGWDVSHFGYLTWAQVRKFSAESNLERTLRVFAFNKGQIYKSVGE